MSQTFKLVLSGPALDTFGSLFAMFSNLRQHGFRSDGSIVRVEENEDEIFVPFDSTAAKSVADWKGAAASFSVYDITLDVVVTRWDSFSNVDVEVGEGTLRRAYLKGRFVVYLTALVEIAKACQAAGGAGSYNFDPGPLSPKDILDAITNNPENPGYPSDLGLFQRSGISQEMIENLSRYFRIEETLGYWLLVGREFEELLRGPA